MHIEQARQLKAELWRSLTPDVGTQAGRPPRPVFVGLSVRGADGFGVAVRYQDAAGAEVGRRAVELGGNDADVREVGPVRALQWDPAALQQRVRPLRPGLSIAHHAVTAGTLGAFVTLADQEGVFALSNNHVLADSDRGRVGDAVLQPGPADSGASRDQVGTLALSVPLKAGDGNTVDAAVAHLTDVSRLDDVDAEYPAGRLKGWVDLDDEVAVEKVGRTTGHTIGTVTAIEIDDLTVQYPFGEVTFDGQIEISGTAGAFSAGGDSGSVVYRPDTLEAVGLLFAGSERGGPGGTGLTYCNPIGEVLRALGATLVG